MSKYDANPLGRVSPEPLRKGIETTGTKSPNDLMTIQVSADRHRKLFSSALDHQDTSNFQIGGSVYVKNADLAKSSPERDLARRIRQKSNMDFTQTNTDRMFKFKDETPFQKWMKLQGGQPATAGDTADPDNMMKQMTNGPILLEDLNKKRNGKDVDPKVRSRSTCDVDYLTAKEQKRMEELEKQRLAQSYKYKLSAKDQAVLQSRSEQQKLEVGIKGYEVKLWHHDINKPVSFGIHKHQRPHHYLDELMRVKKEVPAPTSYNVRQGLEVKRNIMNQHGPKNTFPTEIQIKNRKENFPGPTTYELEWHRLDKEKRVIGLYTADEPRTGYLEEIEYLAKMQPPWKMYNRSY